MKKCILVDGNNLIYRAFYAFERQGLKNPSGKPSGALFGFTRLMINLLKEHNPDYAAVAFDVSKATFRKQLYPEYKAQRRPTPPELLTQIPAAHLAVESMGLKALKLEGYEADDLIGSICELLPEDTSTVIVTGDRDLLQLINGRVTVNLCVKGVSEIRNYDSTLFSEEYGFPPEGIIELKALMGDASDNIPGVKGIGEKKGLALVREFKTVDNLYASIQQISNPKLQQMIIDGRESAAISRELAVIRRDLRVFEPVDSYRFNQTCLERPEFATFLAEWGFNSILSSLNLQAPDKASTPAPESGPEPFENPEVSEKPETAVELKPLQGERLLITSEVDLNVFLAGLGDEICIDVETTGYDPFKDKIVGVALAGGTDKGTYIPVRHRSLELQPGDQIEPEIVFAAISKAIRGKTLVGHNLKFDLKFLSREGVEHDGPLFDTMLASYVDDPTTPNGLKQLSREVLGVIVEEFSSISAKNGFDSVPIDVAARYGCQDVLTTMLLKQHYEKRLNNTSHIEIFKQLETPLLKILQKMETTGIGLNREYLKNLSAEFEARLNGLEAEIHTVSGNVFNVNSTKQLQEVLFEKLGLPPPRKTKTGFSTDNEVLKKLSSQHPVCRLLIEYREVSKMKSTYSDSLADLADPKTGIIHTSFNQMVTATGRLSSSNPNLQNIPIKTETGRSVRRAFVPPFKNHLFLSLDYSQIEIRLLAHFSQDPALIEAFINNHDIHSLTAAKIFNKSLDEITSFERTVGKTVNFGIIYGISPFALSEDLDVPRQTAKGYIDGFFSGFPKVTEYFETNLELARKTGEVSTLMGRTRAIPGINASNHLERSSAERIARNTPLQGSAADLVKKAMIDSWNVLKSLDAEAEMILQIHDELVFSVPEDQVEFLFSKIKPAMENTVSLRVPLVCDASAGCNLADLEPVGQS